MSNPTDARSGIQVLNRTADILRSLQGHPGGLTQIEIGERVDLPRSTVSRLLLALEQLDYVTALGPRGPYRLGPEIIAMSLSARRSVLAELRPYLEALSREVNETVDLSILEEDRAVFLDQVVADHRLRAVSAVGHAFPLHACANGKAMLAAMDPVDLDRVLAGTLERFTPHTLTSVRALRTEIATVKNTGVAYDREEQSDGICAVGALLTSVHGETVAVSIPVPTPRFEGREQELAAAVLRCVESVREPTNSVN
ncbi:MAG: IclR family transcriptional regulator [Actinobacteria bacterium]|nr:IclR family transcriptional regulator [Actinomycetota bacterium]